MIFLATAPVAAQQHYVCQALPPISNVHLNSETIATYGSTKYTKSDDAYFDGEGWKFPFPGQSYLEVDFEMGVKVPYPHCLHLGFTKEGMGQAHITIYVNGELIEFDCGKDESGIDFDITEFLQEGNNTIRIENSSNSHGSFSLRHVGVSVTFNPFERH